jgi:hypothetical protein
MPSPLFTGLSPKTQNLPFLGRGVIPRHKLFRRHLFWQEFATYNRYPNADANGQKPGVCVGLRIGTVIVTECNLLARAMVHKDVDVSRGGSFAYFARSSAIALSSFSAISTVTRVAGLEQPGYWHFALKPSRLTSWGAGVMFGKIGDKRKKLSVEPARKSPMNPSVRTFRRRSRFCWYSRNHSGRIGWSL